MEKNYINWPGKTYFYINLDEKTYGVYVNINESNVDKKINEILSENKERIEAWKKEWKVGVIV